MTSANFFTGYAPEKPTSRVLNPPGGRSNNIFGFDDEPANVRSKAQQENIRPISNIFGPAITKESKQESTYVNDKMKSSLFGDDQTQANNNIVSVKKRTGINPITGRSYDEEHVDEEKKKTIDETLKQQQQQQDQTTGKSRDVHTSSKVSQPPGGRSTKLW